MKDDESLILPPEILDTLREQGWKIGSGGIHAVLLEEAKASAKRSSEGHLSGEVRGEWGACASTILCASAACEARLSEYLAHYEFASGPLPEELAALRNEPDASKQWCLLVRNTSPEYDLGTSVEYQHLVCLFRLRDVVAHRNARLQEIDSVPTHIEDCVRQRILPVREKAEGDWPTAVLVHEVAEWAEKTASNWIRVAGDITPMRC